jgi:hypothetical protein
MLVSDIYHIPIPVSLGVIALLLGGAVLLSILRPVPTASGKHASELVDLSETETPS